MQDFQISSYFIEFHENDYKLWKNYRKKLIKVLSLKLSVISDDILMQINEEWEEALNSPLPNELSQTASQSCLLNKFLFTTIHLYFFRSFERINSTFHLILSYIDKNNFLLTRSGMKCLYWLSIDSKEGEMIFAEPLKILIGLIKDKCKPSLYFNAIMNIKYTRKILKNEINNIFFTESNILLKIGFNSDGILQDEVLKIYRSQEDEPGFYLSTRIYDLAYSKCMSIRLTTLSRIRFAAYIINRIILSSNFQQFVDLSRFSNALIQLKESQKEEEYKKTLNEVTKMIILVTNESSKDFIQIIFNLQLETPTESFLYFIDKFQEHIDFNKLLSLVYANKITCSESLCTFLILEKIIVYSMEYSDNNDLFVDSKRINTTKVCKHFTKCLKLQNSLFTDSIHQKCLDVINNPLLKNEEECLIWIPFFAANVEFFSNRKAIAKSLNDIFFELSDTLRSVIIDTLDFINDPNTRNNFILRIMTTEHKKSLRFQAIQKLILNARISSNPLFYSFINDSCFKVRRFMLFLLESNFKLNPFQTYPVVRTFTLSYFNDILSEVDGRYAMKLASMMPFLAHHCSICQNCRRQYAKTVISTSLTILVERNIHKRDEKDVVNSHHATSKYSVASSMNYSTGSFRTSPDESHSESSITNVEIPEFDEDLLSRPVKNSHQSYTKGNEMSLSKQIKSNYESFYLNRRDVDLLRAVVYLAKYCEPHLQSILNVFYSILTSRSDDYLLEEAIKCLTNFSSQMFNGLNIRLQCPQLISPLLRILSVTSSENLAISILKLFGSSFDSITIQSPSFFNEQPDFNDLAYYTDFILSSILAFSANSNRRTLKAITIIFENDPINSSKYLVKVIPIILSAFDKAHPQQITSLFTYLTCIAAHCPVDSIQLFPQLLTFIQSYLHYEECIKMCIIFGKKFTSDFLTIVSDIYPKIIQHCFLHTLKYFQYSIRFLVLAISRYNQHIDLFLLMLEKIDNVSVWDTSLIVDSLTYLAQQTDVSLYITRFLILASGFNSDISNLMYSLIIYHKFDIHQISFFDINTTELFNEANSLLNDSSKELNSDWNQRLHIIIESKIKIIDLDISMPTISNKYSTLQSYFLEFTYPNETELKKFMNSLILYVINNSPYAGIRGCIEFINYRQHLIKKLFPIAFLSLWKITTKNDRQYFSSIINKIIHEHTSIDGLLMTLIQFLDRNDEPFDIDYITVAKVCKNPHYAYLVLYKRYQRGDKSILPLLFKSALKLNKLDVIKSFFSEAEPLLKKEDIAEYCGYLGNWKKALNIYKEIKAPLSKIINCLYMMKNYPAIYDLSHKFNQIQDQNEREDATIPMLWAYCVFRENTKIENLLKISNNIENNEQFYTFLIIFNISIKKFDQAKFYLDKSLKLIASKRKIFNKGDQFQLQELMNNLQLLYECQEVLEYKSLQMSQETPNWNHRIKYFKRDETTWERMIFLRNMVVPMVSNTSAYLDIIGCV
ncbi:hypothetical protein TRFO_12606 [Tritrichomonas foetus]|uniref:Non-specific serine/threonine protein kinase n=1 Tax=Tritrichomonas foetus TaxID=1144522 RepID=A0A1J4L160_9EUKA|nr:hypothetical protein TRFO_12606 [Tritrichomonas foetus]|eukprot:OHT17255.1 hypothetical protein TRFO_12606 [Tritrichomonas foetus]